MPGSIQRMTQGALQPLQGEKWPCIWIQNETLGIWFLLWNFRFISRRQRNPNFQRTHTFFKKNPHLFLLLFIWILLTSQYLHSTNSVLGYLWLVTLLKTWLHGLIMRLYCETAKERNQHKTSGNGHCVRNSVLIRLNWVLINCLELDLWKLLMK